MSRATTRRRRRVPPGVAAAVLAAMLLAGCGEDAVRQVTDDVASAAGDAASTAAVDAVRDQVCEVVGDRRLSEQDLDVLRGLSATARAAGVDSALLDALDDVTGADGTPPDSAVAQLADACGVSTSSTS